MIQDESAELKYLIEPLKLEDPRLHQALERLIGQVSAVTLEVSPVVLPPPVPAPPPVEVERPTSFRAVVTPTSVRLLWDFVPNASQYEIRTMTQAQVDADDWNSASFVIRTTSTVVDVLPFKGPLQYYVIKSIDSDGNYSKFYSREAVFINMPKQVIVSGSVIDNNVLLTWSKSGDWTPEEGYFSVDKYLIYRDGNQIGETRSSFVSSFENSGGTFTYSIRAVDIAGNLGQPASIILTVSTPRDYIFESERASDFSGTKVNCVIYEGTKLLGPTFVPAQTWQQHFDARTWLDPEDQTTAGYPIYIQPGPPEIGGAYGAARAYYYELIDFGDVIKDVIVTVKYNFRQIDPANPVNIVVQSAWSVDNVNWTMQPSANLFIEQFRYFAFQFLFFGNDKAMIELFNVSVVVSVKREIDGGSILASKDDAAGTVIYFNKPFKDVESITVTPKSTVEPLMAIYDFQDVPDPTFFKVFVFDTTGIRVSATIDWKARGIIL